MPNTPGLDTNIGNINFGGANPATLNVPSDRPMPPPTAQPTAPPTGQFNTTNPLFDKINAVRGQVSDDDIVNGLISQNQETHPDRVMKIQNAKTQGLDSKTIIDEILKQNADPHQGKKILLIALFQVPVLLAILVMNLP